MIFAMLFHQYMTHHEILTKKKIVNYINIIYIYSPLSMIFTIIMNSFIITYRKLSHSISIIYDHYIINSYGI